jgi:hypothetical protein
MNVPLLVLLGFAAWTLLTLFGSIGVRDLCYYLSHLVRAAA